jgi:hypothetical protein
MIIAIATTRDFVIHERDGSWWTRPAPPDRRPGWRIHDTRRERHTIWVRVEEIRGMRAHEHD